VIQSADTGRIYFWQTRASLPARLVQAVVLAEVTQRGSLRARAGEAVGEALREGAAKGDRPLKRGADAVRLPYQIESTFDNLGALKLGRRYR
jgi:hypothetical protein